VGKDFTQKYLDLGGQHIKTKMSQYCNEGYMPRRVAQNSQAHLKILDAGGQKIYN
jgi:hypothetical protein